MCESPIISVLADAGRRFPPLLGTMTCTLNLAMLPSLGLLFRILSRGNIRSGMGSNFFRAKRGLGLELDAHAYDISALFNRLESDISVKKRSYHDRTDFSQVFCQSGDHLGPDLGPGGCSQRPAAHNCSQDGVLRGALASEISVKNRSYHDRSYFS